MTRDLIYRDDAIARIRDERAMVEPFANPFEKNSIMGCMLAVKDVPAVDAVLVVHAKWAAKGTAYSCSNCGFGVPVPCFNYCPECGAKMDQ